ncbi:hypothetical protein PS030_49920, partial [Shigella sonnei]|nr:hypothetical protein [Shigella sonnei]
NAVKRAGLYAQTLPAQLSQLPACGEWRIKRERN